jgi:inosine/xanthosine triphosphate pyrophosphatase family protein
MASIDAEVKNNISHRAIATQLFLKELEESNS